MVSVSRLREPITIQGDISTYAVPCTSERMLEKSLTTDSDVIIYDLEDSVPPASASKQAARDRLEGFLKVGILGLSKICC